MHRSSWIAFVKTLRTLQGGCDCGDDDEPEIEVVNTLRHGLGAPNGGIGIDGDFYIDTTTPGGTIYGPKNSGVWGPGASLQGIGGVPGPQGPAGIGNASTARDIARSDGVSIDTVQGLRNRPLASVVPKVGQRYVLIKGSAGPATDLWLPTGQVVEAELFGVVADADFAGGGTPCAALIEAAIESLDTSNKLQAAIVVLPPTIGTGIRLERPVNIRRSVRVVGSGGDMFGGGTVLVCDPGVTGLRVVGSGDSGAPSGAPGVSLEHFAIRSAGMLNTTQSCTYTSESLTVPLGAAGDFINGQLIALDGVGPQITYVGVTGAVTSGSPTVTLSRFGDDSAVMRAGQYITLGSAYPSPTKIVSVSGLTLTMASNAAASTTGSQVKFCAPLVARIVSGGGTTSLTIDSYAGAPALTSFATTIRHYDCGVEILNNVRIKHVGVGDASGHAFPGAAFALRGDHSFVPASTGVNCSTIEDCQSYGNRHAVFAHGADSNACRIHVISLQAQDWAFLDMSTLGNTYLACHADGGQGYMTHDPPGCASVYVGCYKEGGTVASFGAGCLILGGTMGIFSGGYALTKMQQQSAPYYAFAFGDGTYNLGIADSIFTRTIEFTGALTADATLAFVANNKIDCLVWNHTTGAHNVIVKTQTGTHTTTIANGKAAFLRSDGFEIRRASPDQDPLA